MEMSGQSDFDLFLVRTPQKDICRIDEVRIQAALVRVQRSLGLPDPSNDADYLRMHASSNFAARDR